MPQPMQKTREKWKRLLQHYGNHSVRFHVGQLREGGVGVFGEVGKEKLSFLCLFSEKEEKTFPASVIKSKN